MIQNMLRFEKEKWVDPGEYPSGAGGYPLPSHEFVSDVSGCIKIECSEEQLLALKSLIDSSDTLNDWIKQFNICIDVVENISWTVEIQGKSVILKIDSFDPIELY